MAAHCFGPNLPTPPEHFDFDGVASSACDEMFDPHPDYPFADPLRDVPFTQFNQCSYSLADAAADGHVPRDWANHAVSLTSTNRQQSDGRNGINLAAQQVWLQPNDGSEDSAGSDGRAQCSQNDTFAAKSGLVTPPEASKMGHVEQISADREVPAPMSTNENSDARSKPVKKRETKRKIRKPSQTGTDCGDRHVKNEQKEQYREKNKLAAAKCRNKKRQMNDEIETQARDLEDQNKVLKQELRELRNVVLYYKDQILRHSPQECNCTPLHEYSMNQCARLLQQAHRPSEASTIEQFEHARKHSAGFSPDGNGASLIEADSPGGRHVADKRRIPPSLINIETAMAAQHPEAFMHNYDPFGAQFMSGDEVASMPSTAVSPDGMSDFAGSEMNAMASSDDMFRNSAFDIAWTYS